MANVQGKFVAGNGFAIFKLLKGAPPMKLTKFYRTLGRAWDAYHREDWR